jgi:hypothetical protein
MPFKIVKFLNQAVSYSLIVELKTTNIFLLCSWCKYVCFSAFYDIYSLCFAVGTRTAVHNCHVACRQRKPAICTSIVYGSDRVNTKQIFHFLKLVQCSNSAQETYVISLKPKRRCFEVSHARRRPRFHCRKFDALPTSLSHFDAIKIAEARPRLSVTTWFDSFDSEFDMVQIIETCGFKNLIL